MNFNSVFDELSRLYESVEEPKERTIDKAKDAANVEKVDSEQEPDRENHIEQKPEKERELDPRKDILSEDTEDDVDIEIVDDEEPVAPAKQVLECNKCGALVIKNAADVVVDEETGVANASEACQYCEAEEGYRVIGTFTPFEDAEETDDAADKDDEDGKDDEDTEESADEDELAEGIFSKKPSHALIVKYNEEDVGGEEEWYVFALSSDVAKLKAKEAEIRAAWSKHGLATETKVVDYKTAKTMVDKNDLKTAENLDELFDASINVDATNAGGHGNDVSVLGRSLPEGCSKDKDLDELFDASVNIDAHEFGGTGNNVSVLGTSLPEELEELEEYYDEEAPGGRNTPYSSQRGVGVDCWNQKKSNQWYRNRAADQEMNRDLTRYGTGAKPWNH